MSSPAHPVLMVNGKQTWLAVLNGGSNTRLNLSAECRVQPPFAVRAARLVYGDVNRCLFTS